MSKAELAQMLDRLEELDQATSELGVWRIAIEPHDYPDGTTHFTHVRSTAHVKGEPVTVTISSYTDPETAELLVLLRNNLSDLIRLARAGLPSE
jgi:hypothetical protein